jgi:hypothetical protein
MFAKIARLSQPAVGPTWNKPPLRGVLFERACGVTCSQIRRLHRTCRTNAWRNALFRRERERTALVWTEHLTRLSAGGAPNAACKRLRGLSVNAEVANLPVPIDAINLRNRVAVGGGFHLAAVHAA